MVKHGWGRSREGVPPRGDVGVRVLVWDAPGFGHHRFGGRCLIFPRFWGCTRPVSVVVKHGHGRPRQDVSPHGDSGVRVLVWDTPGFDHHRVGVRCLIFPRFWDCTRPVSVVTKHGRGQTREGVPPLVDLGVLVLVWDVPGFVHHRFGGRFLFFSPVLGVYPTGVGGGQTRTRSGERGRAPFG